MSELQERRDRVAGLAESLSYEAGQIARLTGQEDLSTFVDCALYGGREWQDSFYEADCEGVLEAVDTAIRNQERSGE